MSGRLTHRKPGAAHSRSIPYTAGTQRMSDDLFETKLFEDTKIGFQQPLRVVVEAEQPITHLGDWIDRTVLVRLLNKLYDFARAQRTVFSVATAELTSGTNLPDEDRKILMVASNLFRTQLRDTDPLIQYGPKSICLILPHTDRRRGGKVCNRLKTAAVRAAMTGPHNEAIEPIFGISNDYTGPMSPGENLLTNAENAMRKAIEQHLLQPR